MNEELFAAIAANLQRLDMPGERIQRASAVAQPVNERIAEAALRLSTLDEHPADFITLLQRSAAP
jgi:hypothetical protein